MVMYCDLAEAEVLVVLHDGAGFVLVLAVVEVAERDGAWGVKFAFAWVLENEVFVREGRENEVALDGLEKEVLVLDGPDEPVFTRVGPEKLEFVRDGGG